MATAIGFIGSVLGIYSFIEGELPGSSPDVSSYRIQVGLDGTVDEETGGVLNEATGGLTMIRTYDNNGALIGQGGGGDVGGTGDNGDVGGFSDFDVGQVGSQQSITTEFYADGNAFCAAYISATMPNGDQYGWNGDWGRQCGLNWFPSGYEMQLEDGGTTEPTCTWVDSDHTGGFYAGVIAITWPDFEGDKGLPEDWFALCGTSFRAWANEGGEQILPITGFASSSTSSSSSSAKTPTAARGEEGRSRKSQRSDDRLVISARGSHNATEVCESLTSWGPDFVSVVEGMHCNMETHEVTPLCSSSVNGEEEEKDCFDVENRRDHHHGLVITREDGSNKKKRTVAQYSRVVEWK